jgi:adenylate cyclase
VATKAQIWGDSYEGESSDPFGLQDRVTEGVVKAILPSIRRAEIERVQRKRPEDLNVYDLTMRALPFVLASNPNAAKRALDLLHQAIENNPDYALSAALAALCHGQLAVHNGTRSPVEEKKRALLLAERAALLDPDDPQVLTARCAAHTIAGQFEVASGLIIRALALDPTSGWAWERSGWLKTYSGKPEAGIAHLRQAIRLDPASPSNANRFVGFGCAHFDAGRYDQATYWMRKAWQEQPSAVWVNRTLSVSYARLGGRLAALDSLDALQRYRPELTIGQVLASLRSRRTSWGGSQRDWMISACLREIIGRGGEANLGAAFPPPETTQDAISVCEQSPCGSPSASKLAATRKARRNSKQPDWLFLVTSPRGG